MKAASIRSISPVLPRSSLIWFALVKPRSIVA